MTCVPFPEGSRLAKCSYLTPHDKIEQNYTITLNLNVEILMDAANLLPNNKGLLNPFPAP